MNKINYKIIKRETDSPFIWHKTSSLINGDKTTNKRLKSRVTSKWREEVVHSLDVRMCVTFSFLSFFNLHGSFTCPEIGILFPEYETSLPWQGCILASDYRLLKIVAGMTSACAPASNLILTVVSSITPFISLSGIQTIKRCSSGSACEATSLVYWCHESFFRQTLAKRCRPLWLLQIFSNAGQALGGWKRPLFLTIVCV